MAILTIELRWGR